MAEYTFANNIDYETAFASWVPYIFKKRDMIITKAKTKYWRTTHKYGVSLPRTETEALELNIQTGQPLWENATKKEIIKEEIFYEEVEGCITEEVRQVEVDELKGFQEITCHIIFDVKMDFTCKARYAENVAMNDMPVGLCY